MFSSLKLIEGTQGQVWSFRKIDGRLFCAHTNGLLEILPDLHIRHPYRINTGVFRTLEATINGKQIQIIITYDELLILNRTTGELNSMRQITDPIYNAEVDHLGNIWLETSSRGVYKCRLNDEQSAFRYYTYYGNEKDSSLPARLQLFKSGGRILFLGNDQFYIYDEVNDNLQLEQHLNRCFETIHDLKRIVPIDSEESWAITGSSVYRFFYDGYIARIAKHIRWKLTIFHSSRLMRIFPFSTTPSHSFAWMQVLSSMTLIAANGKPWNFPPLIWNLFMPEKNRMQVSWTSTKLFISPIKTIR